MSKPLYEEPAIKRAYFFQLKVSNAHGSITFHRPVEIQGLFGKPVRSWLSLGPSELIVLELSLKKKHYTIDINDFEGYSMVGQDALKKQKVVDKVN